MRIHLFANQTARGLAKHPERLPRIREIARARAEVHVTRTVQDLERATASLDHVPDLVVLAGGDGTYMAGATALWKVFGSDISSMRIGLLPVGTVGTVAKNFGERGDPLALLQRWLAAPEALVTTRRKTLLVRADDTERVGFIFGTGLIANFFDVYEGAGAGGSLLAAKIVARVFTESFRREGGPMSKKILTPMPLSLSIDGERCAPDAYSLLCASVVPNLGLGMRVTYRAEEDPERIHLVASSLEPSRLGPRMPLVLMGRTIGGRDHVDRLLRGFDITFPRNDGPFVLDGDSFRASQLRVELGPKVNIVGTR